MHYTSNNGVLSLVDSIHYSSNNCHTVAYLEGGGYFHQNRTGMCLLNLGIRLSLGPYINFLPPISILFSIKSTQFCPNWVLFTIICSKYTQFVNLGFFVFGENPPIAIPNFPKKQMMVDMTAEHPVNAIRRYHGIYAIPYRHSVTRFIQV